MAAHPGTWARRVAYGIDLSKPGVEPDHFICAGYYSCTETGVAELVEPRMHVWVPTAFVYGDGIKSDIRAPAYEPMGPIKHIECTAEGLGIRLFGSALLNWPRLAKYSGAHKLPLCMRKNPSLYVYSNWAISAAGDAQEGFVGICIGRPHSPPNLDGTDEDTIGVLGYVQVRHHPALPPRPAPPSRPPLSAHARVAGLEQGGRRDSHHRLLHRLRPRRSSSAGRL